MSTGSWPVRWPAAGSRHGDDGVLDGWPESRDGPLRRASTDDYLGLTRFVEDPVIGPRPASPRRAAPVEYRGAIEADRRRPGRSGNRDVGTVKLSMATLALNLGIAECRWRG